MPFLDAICWLIAFDGIACCRLFGSAAAAQTTSTSKQDSTVAATSTGLPVDSLQTTSSSNPDTSSLTTSVARGECSCR